MRNRLEALFTDWARGDWSTTAQLFTSDVRFSAAQPEGQVEAVGPDAIARFMRGFLAGWESYTTRVHDLEAIGDGQWIATGTQYAKSRTGGLDITAPVHIALKTGDGLITQMEWWLSREHALAALTRG